MRLVRTGSVRALRLGLLLGAVVLFGVALAVGTQSLVAAPEPTTGSNHSPLGPSGGIQNTSISGSGHIANQYDTVLDHPGPPYVWQDEELTVNTTVTPDPNHEEYALCAVALNEDNVTVAEFGCEQFEVPTGTTETVSLNVTGWPSDATGSHRIELEFRSVPDGDAINETRTVPMYILEKDGDLSGDGLSNAREVELGTDFTRADTSGNGLTDWEEVNQYGTDPLEADTSGDGIDDGTIAAFGLNPNQPYILHLAVAGMLVLIALVVGGTVYLVIRAMRSDTAADSTNEPVAAPAPESDSPPPEPAAVGDATTSADSPLTKEEQVCELLRQHDGRLKQARLVEETDWSQATVSRLLSQLERDGTITKLRRGRENIVELTADGPESADPSAGSR